MRACAFLTLADPTGFVIDDPVAYDALARHGWRVDAVPWDQPDVDFARYERVVIRSPWDYPSRPDAFLDVLASIQRVTRLDNPLHIVRWNLDKRYLRDLAARGVSTLPTLWRDRLAPRELDTLFEEVGCDEIVVKPVVSANAEGAFRLDRASVRQRADEVEAYFAARALMVQPFVPSVLDRGESSLFYFNGVHSHSINKTPKARDFRVQEEHGGLITALEAEPALLDAGARAVQAVGETLLYARADFVHFDGAYCLMELELVEPALYFRMHPEAPEHFARALCAGATTP